MTGSTDPHGDPTAEVTDLLQHLIRNACVNDGTVASGQEARSADLLASYLEPTPGLALERYDTAPGRANLVARLEGTDPTAPTLLLMGHTDVVPANRERWQDQRDPFAAELIDGFVWGRGAVDMLNLTASMAVATRRLAAAATTPTLRGALIFLAVADEEALGTYGADWLVTNQRDAVAADFVVTESGGFALPVPSTTPGPKLPVLVAEKGSSWATITVRGTPGHASMPLRTDNALVTAAAVVTRLAEYRPQTRITDTWRRFVEGLDLPAELTAAFIDPEQIQTFVQTTDQIGLARDVHASTHATFAPTILHGGVKTNVIPDTVELQVDIRTLPGQGGPQVHEMLREALGDDLYDRVEITGEGWEEATESPADTPLWHALQRASETLRPGARLVPSITTGATDARFFRRIGATAYGAGLFSERLTFDDYARMFHGDDERVDQESLRLSTELWMALARDLLG